jgi:hypothetical protein
MASALERLGLAAAGVSWLYDPPDWWGKPGLGIAGLSGSPQQLPWDAFASARAPGLTGDEVHFAVDEEGAIISREGLPESSLDPLADALTEQLGPPFVGVAVPDEADVWVAVANEAEIVKVPDAPGEEIDMSSVGGVRSTRVDSVDSDVAFPALVELLDWQGGDASLIAHRFAGDTWVVELFSI